MSTRAGRFMLAFLFAGGVGRVVPNALGQPATSLSALGTTRPTPEEARFEQRIGQQLPLDTVFTNEEGESIALGACFAGRPVVLIFNYFRCPQFCSLVAAGAVDTLRQLRPSIGRDYSVVTVSVDPTDTPEMARAQQRSDVLHYGRTGAAAGWHTLTGRAQAIQALAAAAGFHFSYDPRSRQYAHPSGLVVVTPRGVVSSYFLGVDYPAPAMATALRRAADNRTGPSVFSLLAVCFQGGSPEGRYGRAIWIVLSVSVALTVAAVFGGIAWMLRRELLARAAQKGAR